MKNTNKFLGSIFLIAFLTSCSNDTNDTKPVSDGNNTPTEEVQLQTPESQYLESLSSSDAWGGGEGSEEQGSR